MRPDEGERKADIARSQRLGRAKNPARSANWAPPRRTAGRFYRSGELSEKAELGVGAGTLARGRARMVVAPAHLDGGGAARRRAHGLAHGRG